MASWLERLRAGADWEGCVIRPTAIGIMVVVEIVVTSAGLPVLSHPTTLFIPPWQSPQTNKAASAGYTHICICSAACCCEGGGDGEDLWRILFIYLRQTSEGRERENGEELVERL